jgi:hypothetical protein
MRNQANAGTVIPDGMPVLSVTVFVQRSSLWMRTFRSWTVITCVGPIISCTVFPAVYKDRQEVFGQGSKEKTPTELTLHPKLPNLLLNFVYCIKCIKIPTNELQFYYLLLLYYGQQHVSASHVTILRVLYLRIGIQLSLKCVWITPHY